MIEQQGLLTSNAGCVRESIGDHQVLWPYSPVFQDLWHQQ